MRLYAILLLVFVLNVTGYGQDNEGITGTWYMIDMGGESTQRLILSEKDMKTERWMTYNVEEPFWKEDKVVTIAHFNKVAQDKAEILTTDSRLEGVSPGELWLSKDGRVLYMYNMKMGFNDQSKALQSLHEFKFKALMARPVYSKQRLEEINSLPSTQNLSKTEFIKLIKTLQANDQVLSDFLTKSHVKNAQHRLFQITNSLFNQGLIDLGYNPWKPTEEYFVRRLKQDPEVAALLESQIHFKF